MSTATARVLPARQPAPRPRPVRAVEPAFRPRPNFVRAAIVLGCLGVIFAAQLLLSILVSGGQYEIAALQSQQKELQRTAQSLQERLATLESSQNLAQQATALGMVQGTGAANLRLSDAAVIPAANPTPREDCIASCGLVANELLTGVPLVQRPATTGTTGAAAQAPVVTQPETTTPPATAQEPATDTIPAPVTR